MDSIMHFKTIEPNSIQCKIKCFNSYGFTITFNRLFSLSKQKHHM